MLEFPGALVLVTHDRFMLDRVTNELIGLDDAEGFKHLPDLEQWFKHLKRAKAVSASSGKSSSTSGPARTERKVRSKKLGYLQQRELDGMEAAILSAEQAVEELQAQSGDPDTLADHVRSSELFSQLDQAQAEVRRLYERWEELESLQNGGSGS